MPELSEPVPVHTGQVRNTGPCRAVGNMSSCRNISYCRSGGREFDPARSHTFMEIDHEIIFYGHSPSFRCYKQKYVHEVLVNCLDKLDQEKMWLGELTVPT